MSNIEKREEAEEKKSAGKEQENKMKKILIALSVVLLVLGLAGLIAFLLKDRKGSGSDDDSGSIVTFVPIWIGVWVPLLAASRKKRQELDKNAQMIIIGIGILCALLAIAGLVVFLAVK
jgi:flagellar basal body-associated protein FliL